MILELRDGETCDEFIARVVAASGIPDDSELDAIWAMLPPVPCPASAEQPRKAA